MTNSVQRLAAEFVICHWSSVIDHFNFAESMEAHQLSAEPQVPKILPATTLPLPCHALRSGSSETRMLLGRDAAMISRLPGCNRLCLREYQIPGAGAPIHDYRIPWPDL